MMSKRLWTSDPHFWHRYVAGLRGFHSTDDHDAIPDYNEFLLDRINTAATKRDHLTILGDLGLGSTTRLFETVAQIRAHVHLVVGNHDEPFADNRGSTAAMARWASSGAFASVLGMQWSTRVGGQLVMMSHFPTEGDHTPEDRYTAWRPVTDRIVLHGHVHEPWRTAGQNIHVGLDAWDYSPVTEADLADLVSTQTRILAAA